MKDDEVGVQGGETSKLSVSTCPCKSHREVEGCGERCTRSMMCIVCKHGRADQDNQERPASLGATRRTHSKTKASRQKVVSGACGRGSRVPAGHAQAWTGTSHAGLSLGARVTESSVPTDHQAPRERLDEASRGSRDDSKSRREGPPEAEARAGRQVRTRGRRATRTTTHDRSTALAVRTRVDHFWHGGSAHAW